VVPEIATLYRVARSLSRHDADAEDLVQETLLRAYRALDGFDGRHPRAWLLTILRNAYVNSLKRRPPCLLPRDEATGFADRELADPRIDVESAALEAVFVDEVKSKLALLPPRLRAPMELVDLEGLSYRQAATRLGTAEGTVMSRLHRARRRVRADLEAVLLSG
jgi:RNA polymerase sigma-70 factor (ECF subfamily)